MTRRPGVGGSAGAGREALTVERTAMVSRSTASARPAPTRQRTHASRSSDVGGSDVVGDSDVGNRDVGNRDVARRERPVIPRVVPLAIALAAVIGLTAGAVRLLDPQSNAAAAHRPAAAASPSAAQKVGLSPTASPVATGPTPTLTSSATPTATPAAGLAADDVVAGLLGTTYPQAGNRHFVTVPGRQAAPGRGHVFTFGVQVEQGLPIDGQRFAQFVFATLNDPHSWGHGGKMTFARTDGPPNFRVVLASPATSAGMCAPMNTGGTLSCHNGNAAILTIYRWVHGTPDYGANLLGYRHYLVNHEVGHWLGHGHEMCPGPGKVAPVMMQQTKGLKGCAQNPWPFR